MRSLFVPVKRTLLFLSLLTISTSLSLHSTARAFEYDTEYAIEESELYAELYCAFHEVGGINVDTMATIIIKDANKEATEDPSIENKNRVLAAQRAKDLAAKKNCLQCNPNIYKPVSTDDKFLAEMVMENRKLYPCSNNR